LCAGFWAGPYTADEVINFDVDEGARPLPAFTNLGAAKSFFGITFNDGFYTADATSNSTMLGYCAWQDGLILLPNLSVKVQMSCWALTLMIGDRHLIKTRCSLTHA
jgi:hypothetical protein